MERRKKILVSIVAGILLVALYGMIFAFSDQDGEESGNLSAVVAEKCVEVYNTVARKNWSTAMIKSMAEYFEHPLRKAAHFCEYAAMGALVYLMWRPWKERNRRLYLLAAVWVLLSAAVDEAHQLLVPGRDGNPLDVLLDTFGGCVGIFCITLLERAAVYLSRRFRKHRGQKAEI